VFEVARVRALGEDPALAVDVGDPLAGDLPGDLPRLGLNLVAIQEDAFLFLGDFAGDQPRLDSELVQIGLGLFDLEGAPRLVVVVLEGVGGGLGEEGQLAGDHRTASTSIVWRDQTYASSRFSRSSSQKRPVSSTRCWMRGGSPVSRPRTDCR